MNFLNPLAFIGMLAAGVPLLLHLLNLRKLRTIEFSTLRFLQELQQTQVRKVKLRQILLLILRTLLIALAVLAFARPTIPSNLPLLAAGTRSSVVILVDNSGSMEAADQRGKRLQQAKDNAKHVLSLLTDGDEVCIIPMAGANPYESVGFTRTFTQAESRIDLLQVSTNNANLADAMHVANNVLQEAAHAHHEVYVISDAQQCNAYRNQNDTAIKLRSDASVFLIKIGDGLLGLQRNMSVDSLTLLTQLPQRGRNLEVEASVRNGSNQDATGVIVSMAFQGVRVAQRVLDVPAGSSRQVLLAAPIQKQGTTTVTVELENDAIAADNVRYLGVTVPPVARTMIVGSGMQADLLATALSLPLAEQSIGVVQTVPDVRTAIPKLSSVDVLFLVASTLAPEDVAVVKQFVEQGGGLVVFASDDAELPALLTSCGLTVEGIKDATPSPWSIRSLDEHHPLLEGVFKNEQNRKVVESPRIKRQFVVSGGFAIATSDVGPFLTESIVGHGRVLFFAVGIDGTWGPFGGTGFFPATMVRAALYLNNPTTVAPNALIGSPIYVPLPARYQGIAGVSVNTVSGITMNIPVTQSATGAAITIPEQQAAGVAVLRTDDSTDITAVALNAPTTESELHYQTSEQWKQAVEKLVSQPEHVVLAEGRTVTAAVMAARQGSELWPLCIVLALACAVAEMLVSRLTPAKQDA